MASAPERILFLLIDGVGDVSVPELGDRTPLEVAHTPHLDAIAAGGFNGLLDPVEPGLACGSDTAHMSLFGYDPRSYYRGRGAFESMGAGIPMAPGDIAFKCNFATLDASTCIVTSRRADRHFEHLGPPLCEALNGIKLPSFPHHTVTVRYATEHRCGVAVSGPGLSDAVSGTDPLKDNLPLLRSAPEEDTQEARMTAALVNELSDAMRAVLADHPINAQRAASGEAVANVVLLRGCGSRIRVPSFRDKHGLRAALVAPTKIIAGLGMSFGIECLDTPGANGSYNSAFHAKAETICEALASGRYDFGFVHVKAVDDTGHDRMLGYRVRYYEVVDKMVGQMLKRLHDIEAATSTRSATTSTSTGTGTGAGSDGPSCSAPVRFTMVVCGDHSTPVVFGDHSHEPVPFTIAHVWHAVEALGGEEDIVRVGLGPIPVPDVKNGSPPAIADLLRQAQFQDMRRKAAWSGRPWDPMMPPEVFGVWRDPWPQAVRGDPVRSFDELSAARGGLGRFPGSQVMNLVKQFAGWPAGEAAGPPPVAGALAAGSLS